MLKRMRERQFPLLWSRKWSRHVTCDPSSWRLREIWSTAVKHVEQNRGTSLCDRPDQQCSQIPAGQKFPAETTGRSILRRILPLKEFRRTQWQERPVHTHKETAALLRGSVLNNNTLRAADIQTSDGTFSTTEGRTHFCSASLQISRSFVCCCQQAVIKTR